MASTADLFFFFSLTVLKNRKDHLDGGGAGCVGKVLGRQEGWTITAVSIF